MEPYIVVLGAFGALVLLTAWLPMALKEAPLSLPIACVAIGAALFAIPGLPGLAPHPSEQLPLVERLTEFVVIIALMGAGLKLDRPLSLKGWSLTWRLLGISMPITIALLALAGWFMLGIGVATAILLAASLAPTDPVLASDVQVGPPGEGEEDETRFTLTSEAGLNDGLAFPFVMLAIALAQSMETGEPWFWRWLSIEVVWRLAAGVGMGWGIGWVLGWLMFKMPNRATLSRTGDGFVALGVTCLAYALTEMFHGYGFLAVFVAALALRAAERGHHYHEKLHDFAEQLERLLMMALLVLFGGSMSDGELFRALSWEVFAFAALAILVIRPLSGWIGLIGQPTSWAEKAVISFYGIRGIGSSYYLAYGLQKAPFDGQDVIWSAAGLIVLVSIVLHGATVTPVMRRLDRRRENTQDGPSPAGSPARSSPSPAPSRSAK